MIKKDILIALVLVLSVHTCYSQFYWGVRTGFQYSKLHFNKSSGWNQWKPAYIIPGFYFEQHFNNRSAISADIQFANKGFKWLSSTLRPTSANEPVLYMYNLPYIDIPLFYIYKPSSTFSVFAGPEFGFKLSSSSVIQDERIVDNKIFTNRYDIGISGGFSYQFLPCYRVMFRYTQGLSNVLGRNVEVIQNGWRFGDARKDLGYKYNNMAFQLSLSSVFVIPESDRKTVVSFGIRQGVSFYTFYGSGVQLKTATGVSLSKRIGYEIGLEARFGIKKYFFMSTGLSYLQKGGKVGGNDPLKVNYLSLPVIFGVSPIKSKMVTISVEAGLGLNKELKSVNPYNDHSSASFNYIKYPHTMSFIYGFEVSTDVIRKLSLFLSYRNVWDDARFFEMEAKNYNSYYEFISKGQSMSFGVRLRHEKRSSEASPVNTDDYETVFDNNRSSIGLKGGFNFNAITYKNPPTGMGSNDVVKPGGHIGMYFKVKLGKRLALIPELQYIHKQSQFSAIENPIMVACIINKWFTFETGPQWGILQPQTLRTTRAYIVSVSKIADVGWSAGMHYKVSQKVSLGCRYYHGLKDIITLYANGRPLPTEGYNRNVQVSTFYKLSRKY